MRLRTLTRRVFRPARSSRFSEGESFADASRSRPQRSSMRQSGRTSPIRTARLIRGPRGFVQGYNAQAVCTESQVMIAAELSTDSPDGRLLEPMIRAAPDELAAVGIHEAPGVVVADGGYWNVPRIEELVMPRQ